MATKFITKDKGAGRKVIPMNVTSSIKKIKDIVPKYTPIQKAIVNMLTEDTGANALDSGGAYGRNYERNQQVKDWTKEAPVIFDESGITRNLFAFLDDNISITSESAQLQKRYDKMMAKSDEPYLSDMEQFLDILSKKGELEDDDYVTSKHPTVVNTYNKDSTLSQILQYAIFYKDGQYYIIMQVHNGCDARGGYTTPRIFELDEADSFILQQTNVNVTTKKGSYYSDDNYNFYDDEDTSKSKQWEAIYAEGVVSVS